MNRAIPLSVYLTASFLSGVIVLLANMVLAEAPGTVYIGFPTPEWTPQNASIKIQMDMPFASAFLKQLRRQAVLTAARDELGVETRDAFLSETITLSQTTAKIGDIDRFIVDHVEHFEQNIFAQNVDYPRFLAEMEKFAAIPPNMELPDWIRLAQLYADFDLRGMTEFIEKPNDKSELTFAKLLKFFLLEFSGNRELTIAFGQPLLTDIPECSRIFFGLYGAGHFEYYMPGNRQNIQQVQFNNYYEQIIATGSYDNTVILWDAQTGEPLRRLGMFNGDVVGLAFSPDGSKLAVSKNYNGEHTYILDTKTWKTILYAPGHGWWNGKPSWSSDGRFIVTCGNDTRIEKIPSDDEAVPNDKFAGKADILLKDFGVAGVSSGAEPPKFNTFSSSRKKFTESLWGHAASRFVVPLNGHWQIFKTSFGISTSANLDEASCFFVVIGDGKELFRSELIRDSLDRPLELDVRNIKQLELIVDPNGNNHNDHGV